jgi:hypothetical protein
MKDRQPPLYLITGLVIGILVGLFFSYVILPVRYTDTQPSTLNTDQKAVFRGLIARAYLYEADSKRAFSRLALLKEDNLGEELVVQAQRMVADGEDVTTARGLALLASVLTDPEVAITPLAVNISQETAASVDLTKSPQPTITSVPATATPFVTYTPRPTPTTRATQGAPYQMAGDPREICDPDNEIPMMKVYVYDKIGEGISGVKIQISTTTGGQGEFFTGFFPEISSGYADYAMISGETYSLRVGEGGELISGLSVPECKTNNGGSYPGGLEVKFKQP